MAEVTHGLLKNIEGHLDDMTIYKRGGKIFARPSKIHQPRRLSRKQLALREQITHNNILWRSLKATGYTYFEGGADPYRRFMSVNRFSPTVYLTKRQARNNFTLLLPGMAVSNGPLPPIQYQLDQVDGQPALLTDLTLKDIRKGEYLLYVLRQEVFHWQNGEEDAQMRISVVPITSDQDIVIPRVGTVRLMTLPSGTIALVGDLFSEPMFGFSLVHIKDSHVSPQLVVTNCTYYERFTTEDALQSAAQSYGGLT